MELFHLMPWWGPVWVDRGDVISSTQASWGFLETAMEDIFPCSSWHLVALSCFVSRAGQSVQSPEDC